MRQSVSHHIVRNVSLLRILRGACLVRAVAAASIVVVAVSAIGCGELEPIAEPDVVDLKLTIDTLKSQVRDAQRNLTEVRKELESRRQELADAQVARAQFEGRVREAERRLAEARHIIELQREELVAARVERERVFRSTFQLQGQLKQLQQQIGRTTRIPDRDPDGISAPISPAIRRGKQAANIVSSPAGLRQDEGISALSVEQKDNRGLPTQISVKPGDTLWSISRRYGIDLDRLRSLNHLTGDQILVGQILWVSEGRTGTDSPLGPLETSP